MSLLLDVRGVAQALTVSARHVLNLVAAGVLPPPLKLGRSARWRAVDISAFVTGRRPRRQTKSKASR
jgi:predicted DNA-binding transcriptional regulator AlpA